MISPVKIPKAFSADRKGKVKSGVDESEPATPSRSFRLKNSWKSPSKSNLHEQSSDFSGLPTIGVDESEPATPSRSFRLKSWKSPSKSNLHAQSSDSSGLPTIDLDSTPDGSGSSGQLMPSRSPKKAFQEKEFSSPKKSRSHFRLAPPRVDKRQEEDPETPKKTSKKSLEQFKLTPSRANKRYEFEYRSSSTRMTKTSLPGAELQRSNSDRNLDPVTLSPIPSPRNKASFNRASPNKTLNSLDDFMTEYTKIMDDFPEQKRVKGKKASISVIGW
jgi:hypothetical protein